MICSYPTKDFKFAKCISFFNTINSNEFLIHTKKCQINSNDSSKLLLTKLCFDKIFNKLNLNPEDLCKINYQISDNLCASFPEVYSISINF